MRRRGSRLLALIVVVLLGYVAWQMYSLKREVASLRAEVTALKASRADDTGESSGTLSLILKARHHAEEARKYFLRGETERARAELEKSLRLIEQASEDTGSSPEGTLDRVRSTLRDTRDSIERLWQRLGSESDDSKGG